MHRGARALVTRRLRRGGTRPSPSTRIVVTIVTPTGKATTGASKMGKPRNSKPEPNADAKLERPAANASEIEAEGIKDAPNVSGDDAAPVRTAAELKLGKMPAAPQPTDF